MRFFPEIVSIMIAVTLLGGLITPVSNQTTGQTSGSSRLYVYQNPSTTPASFNTNTQMLDNFGPPGKFGQVLTYAATIVSIIEYVTITTFGGTPAGATATFTVGIWDSTGTTLLANFGTVIIHGSDGCSGDSNNLGITVMNVCAVTGTGSFATLGTRVIIGLSLTAMVTADHAVFYGCNPSSACGAGIWNAVPSYACTPNGGVWDNGVLLGAGDCVHGAALVATSRVVNANITSSPGVSPLLSLFPFMFTAFFLVIIVAVDVKRGQGLFLRSQT